MTEHDHDSEPYWQHDLALGDGLLHGERTTIRVRLHVSDQDERARDGLLPKPFQVGRRTFLHARPYILEPAITLTLGQAPRDGRAAPIGILLASDSAGLRHREIGQAQAWGYPESGTAVLWEAYLFDRFRLDDPLQDATLATLWTGLEQVLAEHQPGLARIVSPGWEDGYDRELWQDFLRARGYQRFTNRAFVKELGA